MIKVVFIIDTLETGGAERSLVEMAFRFKKVTPVFIHIYRGDSLKRRLVENGIAVYSLNIEKKYGFRKAIQIVLPIIYEINPDIIHSTLNRSDIISRGIKKKINIPVVNSFVSNSYHLSRYSSFSVSRKFKHRLVQLLDKWTAKKVDLFISNSHVIKEDNAKALGLDRSKIKVIPRGRISEDFQFSEDEKVRIKEKLGFKNNRVILNVGRLIKSKGQLDLVLGFANIAEQYKDILLVIAGEGSYRKNLEQKIQELKLQDRILLLGNRQDIPELLSIANIFVFSSYLEGLPGSIIEAMIAKTLIICSDIPENRECLPEDAGIFYPVGDVNQLSAQMQLALNETETTSHKKMVEKAYRHATNEYELDKIVAQYEQIYLELSSK